LTAYESVLLGNKILTQLKQEETETLGEIDSLDPNTGYDETLQDINKLTIYSSKGFSLPLL
jgi:hypothetical protein